MLQIITVLFSVYIAPPDSVETRLLLNTIPIELDQIELFKHDEPLMSTIEFVAVTAPPKFVALLVMKLPQPSIKSRELLA